MDIIGEYVYSTDNEELADVVANMLLDKNITISCAESCTGGLFAGTLINTDGISKVFDRGIVTYSNEAKIKELGVKAETLDTFGAVSPETAAEMAEGIRAKTGTNMAVSVTGIAGPGGGSADKPVGLVYIGIAYDGKTDVVKAQMRNVTRNWNRNYAVLTMLHEIYKRIK